MNRFTFSTVGLAAVTALHCSSSGGFSAANSGAGTSGTGASGTGNDGGASGAGAIGGATSGASGMVGESGAAGDGITPCDTTKSPSEESCLVSDDYAVFVAPNGKNTAAGTMKAPLATLSKAIEVAAGSKFVIVCDATYDEHVTVPTGAQVYGGFKCSGGTWTAEVGAPLFKPSDQGPALKIDGVATDIVIDSVGFEVPDATQPGGSAVVAFVSASPKVKLSNVSLKAGAGMKGLDGTLQLFNYLPQALLSGNAEKVGPDNGAEKVCACQLALQSVGGGGGPPSSTGQSGAMGGPDHGAGQPGTPATNDCGNGGSGKKGGDASATSPSAGAATVGTIVPGGWLPASGLDGATGSPGQGGGGGASLNNLGHGGGGGCGGCGGNGGTGGIGGGGSIALLAFNSPVVLNGSALATADAGDGGNGIAGQPGQQTVGSGGNSISGVNSCGGGIGGKGGGGGAGGGGAGGLSVGIVWKGATAPTLTGTTTMTGKAGAKGIGGVPNTNDGIAGVKQDVLQVP